MSNNIFTSSLSEEQGFLKRHQRQHACRPAEIRDRLHFDPELELTSALLLCISSCADSLPVQSLFHRFTLIQKAPSTVRIHNASSGHFSHHSQAIQMLILFCRTCLISLTTTMRHLSHQLSISSVIQRLDGLIGSPAAKQG